MSYTVADNYPYAGCIAWVGCHIVYKGEDYAVADGYTEATYVWWDYDYPNVFQASNAVPQMTDDDALVFLNKNGTHLTVSTATVVDGGLIVPESIITDALAANCVTGIKILAGEISAAHIAADAIGAVHIAADAVTAEKINVENLAAISANLGTVNAGFINVGEKVIDITDVATTHDGQIQNDSNVTAYFPFDDSLYDSKNLVTGAFTRDSVAYLPNGTQVASGVARYDTARIVRGVLIEEGTTNLLTNGDCEADVPKLGNAISYTRCTGALDNTQKHSGSSSLKVTNEVGASDIHVQIGNTGSMNGLTAGQPYTFSTWVYVPFGLNINLNTIKLIAYDYDGVYRQVSGELATKYDEWQRLTVTITIQSNATQAFFRLYYNQQIANAPIYWDDLQVENKSYATSLALTTRAPESLTIPTTGIFQKGNWTVELTYIPTSDLLEHYCAIWLLFIDDYNYYQLYTNPDGNIVLFIVSNGTTFSIVDSSPLTVGEKYAFSASGNGSVLRLCKNGQQIGADTPYSEPIGALPSSMFVGSNVSSTQANGIIDELRFSKVARTLVEHQTYYNSQKGYTDIEPIIRAGLMINGWMVTPDRGSVCYHYDGSYSQQSWEGFMRYKAGEGKAYHYLTEIARLSTVGGASNNQSPWWTEENVQGFIPPVSIQLPDGFKGKKFSIFAEPRITAHNIEVFQDFFYNNMYHARVFITEVYDIDYVNATFKVKAYSWIRIDISDYEEFEHCRGIDLTYTVTA